NGLCPCLSFPARGGDGRRSKRVRCGRNRRIVEVEGGGEHSGVAANRDRFDGHRAIAAIKELQRARQRGLRLDRYHPRAEAAEGGGAVADMRADIEDEITRSHELPVKAVHRRAARTVTVIDPKWTRHTSDSSPGIVPRVVPRAMRRRRHGRVMTRAATSRSQAA